MRRGFRRAMRQAGRPGVPPMLRRAHRWMAAGEYAAAAEAFEMLGNGGEARGVPRAANFYLQAGRARVMAGQPKVGFDHLMHGLTLMAATGFPGQLERVGGRVVAELNQQGLTAEAAQVAQWLRTRQPVAPEANAAPARKPVLPTNCPGCGGPVRADEVEWIDEVTAECTWCGNPVRAEI